MLSGQEIAWIYQLLLKILQVDFCKNLFYFNWFFYSLKDKSKIYCFIQTNNSSRIYRVIRIYLWIYPIRVSESIRPITHYIFSVIKNSLFSKIPFHESFSSKLVVINTFLKTVITTYLKNFNCIELLNNLMMVIRNEYEFKMKYHSLQKIFL